MLRRPNLKTAVHRGELRSPRRTGSTLSEYLVRTRGNLPSSIEALTVGGVAIAELVIAGYHHSGSFTHVDRVNKKAIDLVMYLASTRRTLEAHAGRMRDRLGFREV